MNIAIVTDSAAGIAKELLKKYRIGIVPFPVRVGKSSFLDGINITPDTFFKLLRGQSEPDVSTSMPSVETFTNLYQRMAEWTQGIVSVHIAGEQSGTCDAARLAAEESPVPVEVIDTGTTAMAEGFVALEAAKVAQNGAALCEVAERARQVISNVELLALLETVSYAFQGGRLKQAARLLGNLLHIHPLIQVAGNKVNLTGQARRYSKGVKQLVERIVDKAGDAPVHLAVHYSEDRSIGETILLQLQQRLNCVESYLTQIPVPLGAHAGPGSVGIAIYIEDKLTRFP